MTSKPLYYALYYYTKSNRTWVKEAVFLDPNKARKARDFYASYGDRTYRIVAGQQPFPRTCDDNKMLDWGIVE